MLSYIERIYVAWDDIVHPQLQEMTEEDLDFAECEEIENNILLRATSPALAAANALANRSPELMHRFSRGMRIRPLGRIIGEWYSFAAMPIITASSVMGSADPVRRYRQLSRAHARLDNYPLGEDSVGDESITAYLQLVVQSLVKDPTGSELIQYGLTEILPRELEDNPDIAHIIDSVAHLGAERYQSYYAHGFKLLYPEVRE